MGRSIIKVDELVNTFLNRRIEGEWHYLWNDAIYLKERKGRIVSIVAIVAVGVNTLGKRDVLGVANGPSED